MDRKEQNNLRKYLLLQRDLGFEELYLPESSRPAGKLTVKRLSMDRFSEAESIDQLEATIRRCKRCPLAKTRTNFVFGVGNPDADIMFVGEAPGRDEDLQGIPFVGRAGKLLDKMLAEVGLRRDDVYITNVLKSRPPNNRDPEPEEVEQCMPYLLKQIQLIKPSVICCLGRIAAQSILQSKLTLGAMRNRWFDFHGIRLMVTYHPAAILRTNSYMAAALEDFRKLADSAGRS